MEASISSSLTDTPLKEGALKALLDFRKMPDEEANKFIAEKERELDADRDIRLSALEEQIKFQQTVMDELVAKRDEILSYTNKV